MSEWQGKVWLVGGKLPGAGIVELKFGSNEAPDDTPTEALTQVGDEVVQRLKDDRVQLVLLVGVVEVARAHLVGRKWKVERRNFDGTVDLLYEQTVRFAVDPRDSGDLALLAKIVLHELSGELELLHVQLNLDLECKGNHALQKLRRMVASGEIKVITH